jgi:glycosyltransferase involved in cell wall biosynthesis
MRPMRIAHVITRLIIGGAQENTLLSCEGAMRRHGDDVLLITGPAIGLEGSLMERARAGGTPLAIIPTLRRAIHPRRDWQSYRRIVALLREFKPDVVHTHSAKGGILGRAAASRLRVSAIVHTVHGAPLYPQQSIVLRAFSLRCERWAANRCDMLVSVADAMTELCVAYGIAPRDKFVTIHSGLEVEPLLAAAAERERVRAELGYRPEDVVVGKIARLFELKGHEYLLQAAPTIISAQPNVKFLLIGDGILRAKLEARVAALGLADRFRFLGLVAPERIPELIAAMDMVMHVSLREGLARALVQALIVGRPVISYDIDGAREVVIDGETGFLLPPQSVEPLATAIVRLAADAALRDRLGAEGRRRFTDRFRWERMVDDLHALYARILESKRFTRGRSDLPDAT